MSAGKSKRKKIKYRKITFKFSKKEYEVLEHCAMLEKTTINKFIKRSIRNELDTMMPRLKQWLDAQQPENQLKLFSDEDNDESMQTSMIEEYEEFYQKEDNES